MQFATKEHSKLKGYREFILGADIGGTNSNFGLFGVKNKKIAFLVSFHFKSNSIKNFRNALKTLLVCLDEIYGIKISRACIAVAGALSAKKDYAKVTNSNFHVSKKEIMKCGFKNRNEITKIGF